MRDYLFVYGSLMSGAGHSMGERLRREARLVGKGTIAGRLYRVSWYPGAVESDDTAERVHGEIYRLASPAPTLRWLDRYEGIVPTASGQSEYERVERVVRLASGREITAWVYLYRRDVARLEPIASGRWVPLLPDESSLAFAGAVGTIRQKTIGRWPDPGSVCMSSRYHDVYAYWKRDPEGFWAEAAREVDWYKPWDKVFDPYAGQYGRWFVGAECNTAWNCLDRHVERGRGRQPALIYDSPVTNTTRTFTYAELRDEVATLGGVLHDMGVKQGDRVVIYMPMVPEAVIAMLACARIGAIHSVVFGGFAAPELATRIDDAKPVAVLAASCGIEPGRIVAYKPLLDSALELARHKPGKVLMLQRPMAEAPMVAGRDYDWASAVADAKARGRRAGCVSVKATDPLYILYTSGTTGQPKGVVRDSGGHMVALKWTMKNHYGVEPGEAFWAASDVGWVVGHSYICYAPLLHGCTTILYEGKPVGTPDAGAFWRVIADHGVVAMFTAPTAFRAIKKEDPKGEHIGRYDLSRFRTLFLAGERADPETIKWAEANLKVPVYDHWWQTETGWAICGNPVGLGALPVKYGSPTVPMPGYDLRVLDNAAREVKPGETGTLVIKLPLPPSCLPTLWNNDERFRQSYLSEFPGFYTTSDAGYIDADGYAFVMARTDDVINVAGHRLSTGQMEEVVARHKDVAECAVVGVADPMKGQIPAGFIVLNAGVNRPADEIESEVVKLVRDEIGPVAAFKTVMIVKRLPKTRSGKILRGTVRQIADGEEWKMPATIDDPAILDEITDAMRERGMVRAAAKA